MHALQNGMINVEARVARSELRPQRVLNDEPVAQGFENGRLGEPGRGVDLELVGVLAGLETLSFRELHDDLLHRDQFLLLSIVRLELLRPISLNRNV